MSKATAIKPSVMATHRPNSKNKNGGLSVPKIVTAGLSGLAGGAAVSIVIAGAGAGLPIALLGSLVGAGITGGTEYSREKRRQERQ